MLIGITVVAVPLGIAIPAVTHQMRTLANRGQSIVTKGAASTRASWDLFAQVVALERAAKMYTRVYRTPEWLDTYKKEHTRVNAATRDLLKSNDSAEVREILDQIGREQSHILDIVEQQPAGTETMLDQHFKLLTDLADRVTQQSKEQISAELEAFNAQSEKAQTSLIYWAISLLPLTAAGIIVFTFFIVRPLRKLDRAISELGHGSLTNPISVAGPKDIEILGAKLEWLRTRLLEVAEERNRFLRQISHELKTPLANIREGTDLLMDGAVGELEPNQREVTAILRENGFKLQRMIENLLSYSAWQNSSIALDPSEFRLRKVVKQVVENQEITILSQRVRLNVQIEDVTLVADRAKIRLILENLLSNAVKYSPKGGTIHLQARSMDSLLVLEVADGGPGIPVEERAHIFEAFYTGRAAKTSQVKGTGIGLSVVLEFVSAHQGNVEIIDGEFPGAHFRITMPINTGQGDRAQAHAA